MEGLKLKYFVLKPHGKDVFAAASRKAMRAYAQHIYSEDPIFAEELIKWAATETLNSIDEDSGKDVAQHQQ